MVQVLLNGHMLDTRNVHDQNALVDATGRNSPLSLQQFTTLVQDLEALGNQRTPFEAQLLMDARMGQAIMADLSDVYARASQGGVWATARIMVDNTTWYTGQAYASGHQAGAYSLAGEGVGAGELNASQHDSEVGVLEELNNALSLHWNTLNGTDLKIIISSSLGPCLGCQGRIRQFLRDQNAVVCNIGGRIRLLLEVNYTTATQTPGNATVALPRQTQYGYTTNYPFTLVNSGPGMTRYWSKNFQVVLGASPAPQIVSNPA
jgi:hypothetical protein